MVVQYFANALINFRQSNGIFVLIEESDMKLRAKEQGVRYILTTTIIVLMCTLYSSYSITIDESLIGVEWKPHIDNI